MSKVIIAGGGAAGMMAAVAAADAGHRVILYEKNEKLGKKLYITGKGRCNLTNNCDVEGLLNNVMRNPKFLYSGFYAFDSAAVMDFFEREGLPLKTERGNRVFPRSDKSSDVIRTLQGAMKQRGVEVHLNTAVKSLCIESGACSGIVPAGSRGGPVKRADAVIVATGGLSYPSTGSTGDGYRFASGCGHSIQRTVPSLVPIVVKEGYVAKMQGLSLRNVELTIKEGKKVLFRELGEMLFTHFGVSGPLILSASSVVSGRELEKLSASIDLKPALSAGQLDERILRDFRELANCFFKNSLHRLLPAKMIPVMVELSGILPEKKVNEVTKQERARLVGLFKEFPFTVTGFRGYNEAVVTRGGVSVREVDPATMQSKKVKNLYFAGEVLDLDARTGGYNLQIAWSTGYLAGSSIP